MTYAPVLQAAIDVEQMRQRLETAEDSLLKLQCCVAGLDNWLEHQIERASGAEREAFAKCRAKLGMAHALVAEQLGLEGKST